MGMSSRFRLLIIQGSLLRPDTGGAILMPCPVRVQTETGVTSHTGDKSFTRLRWNVKTSEIVFPPHLKLSRSEILC